MKKRTEYRAIDYKTRGLTVKGVRGFGSGDRAHKLSWYSCTWREGQTETGTMKKETESETEIWLHREKEKGGEKY